MKRPFVYSPEDINKEFADVWKSLRRNRSADVSSVDVGADMAPDTVRHNTIQFNDNGDVWYVDREGNSVLLSGGGVGGNTIYTGDDQLDGNREIDLDGNFLTAVHNTRILFRVDPTAGGETSTLAVYNATGAGNQAYIQHSATNSSASTDITGLFNDGIKQYNILGNATTFGSSFTYTADTHTFNVGYEALKLDGTTGLEVASLKAFDNTGGGNEGHFLANTSNVLAQSELVAFFDDGAKIARIRAIANSTESTITHTADTHTMIAEGQNNLSVTKLSSQLRATDGDNTTQLDLYADFGGGSLKFSLQSNPDVGNTVQIEGDAITGAITHTADQHTFNANDFFIKTATYPAGLVQVSESNGRVSLGDFDDEVNGTKIEINDSTQSITHTADIHTFNADGQENLKIQKLQSKIRAADGTAFSQLVLDGDAVDPSVRFDLRTNDGVNNVRILGDATANSITHTADTHTFITGGEENGRISLGSSFLRAFNATDDDNTAIIGVDLDETSITGLLSGSFNGGVKSFNITGFADATTSTITYTADTHTFNADASGGIIGIVGGQTNLSVSESSSTIKGFTDVDDGNVSTIKTDTDGTSASFLNDAQFNDGDNVARIIGNADVTLGTITFIATGDGILDFIAPHVRFSSVQEYANNAAAVGGGLVTGDLYYTNVAGDGILKVVI